MYVCIYVYIHIYTYICIYIHIHMHTHTHTHAHTHTHTHTHTHACMHTHMYACTHTYTHVCRHACMHTTHACMHARTHAYSTTHVLLCMSAGPTPSCTHPLSHTRWHCPPTHKRTQTQLHHLRACAQCAFPCDPVIPAIGDTQPRPATLRTARPAARPLRRCHAGRKRENNPCCQFVAFGVPLRLHFIMVLAGMCVLMYLCVYACV